MPGGCGGLRRGEKGRGGLHEVHDAVEVCAVEGHDLDGGLGAEHDEGADEVLAQDLSEAVVRVLPFCSQVLVPCLFAELLCFFREDGGGVCLWQPYGGEDLDDDIGN